MIARIRKALEEKDDKGFTLVELLVVIIIIGILAAIAIPLYLNQQAKAKDSATKSDLKNAQVEVASYLVENPNYTGDLVGTVTFPTSPGTTFVSATVSSTGFCIDAGNAAGDKKDFKIDANGNLTTGTC